MMAPSDAAAKERAARRQQLKARIGRLGVHFEVSEITEAVYRMWLREIQAEIESLEAASRPRVDDPLSRRLGNWLSATCLAPGRRLDARTPMDSTQPCPRSCRLSTST
jgi:hypothetical protein